MHTLLYLCGLKLNSDLMLLVFLTQDKDPEYLDFSGEDYEDPIMNKLMASEGHWLTTVSHSVCCRESKYWGTGKS